MHKLVNNLVYMRVLLIQVRMRLRFQMSECSIYPSAIVDASEFQIDNNYMLDWLTVQNYFWKLTVLVFKENCASYFFNNLSYLCTVMIYESDLYISHRDFRYRAAPSAKAWLFCALLLATGPRASCIHEPALVRADAIYLTADAKDFTWELRKFAANQRCNVTK